MQNNNLEGITAEHVEIVSAFIEGRTPEEVIFIGQEAAAAVPPPILEKKFKDPIEEPEEGEDQFHISARV